MKSAQPTPQGEVMLGAPVDRTYAPFEQALQRVCAALPLPCAVFDTGDDALILANPAFLAEFGAPPPVSRTMFEQGFEPVSVLGGQEAHSVEVFCPRSGRSYSFQWTQLRHPRGCELAVLSTQDLTERMDAVRRHRALQEQLLSSSRAMSVGEMATTLAHEINQPLATIVNCLTAARTLLAQRATHTQRMRQALDLAFDQAGQAAAVVARIREFVRTREPRREPVELKNLINRVVKLQQVDAQKQRVHIAVEAEPDLPVVMADRIMVEQVLTNLVRNGIEAMRSIRPARRSLTITARCNVEARVEVRVADHGPGISAADEAQLFTPFFTTKPDGMGIGLAICRSIIEFHEGHLCFERNPAGGSVFAFTLPRAAGP
jgi:C4-dicarboxylate-specific signal transduction histidine kinase